MVWYVEKGDKPKSWPSWVTAGIAIVAIVVAAVLVVGVVRYAARCGDEVKAKIHGMAGNELWVFVRDPIFDDDEESRHPTAKEVMVHGETNADVEVQVRVPSADNVTVEYRTDGKDFATIRLAGWTGNGTADAAVFLIPGNDRGRYEYVRREVHRLHVPSYENCPICNPGKQGTK